MKRSKIANDRQLRMKQAQKQFGNWRKTKSRRGSATPKHLWEAAVKLYGEYSTCEISKNLRVCHNKLKKLISESANTKLITASQKQPSKQHTQVKTKAKPTPTFIQMEIPPPSQPKQNQWSIEMEKTDGTKMKISGNGSQMPDIALICQSFVEHKR